VTEADRPASRSAAELGFERIRYEKVPPRPTIMLDRPERLNAFDFRMLRELARAREDASWDRLAVSMVTDEPQAAVRRFLAL
jgi:enoyl-CoA hydratase/carnithine racemase